MSLLKRWAGRLSDARWPPFRVSAPVLQQTFVRMGPKKISAIEEDNVTSLAHQLEATLVMGEMLENPDEPVVVNCTYRELLHFVGYMRQLDALYRNAEKQLRQYQEKEIERSRQGRPPVGEI